MGRSRRTLGIVALLAIVLVRGAEAAPGDGPGSARPLAVEAGVYCADAGEAAMLESINGYRAELGLGSLTLSPTLGAAARHHAESMAEFDYFDTSHELHFQGPGNNQSVSWRENIASHGYPDNTHTDRAENLAAGYEAASDTLMQWQNSPSHDVHLRNDRFRAVGIGRAYNPDSAFRWYWTVTFGSLVDLEAQPCAGVASMAVAAETDGALRIARSGANGAATASGAAHDGDPGTVWWSTGDDPPRSANIWFDLGEVRAVSRIEWQFAEEGGADSFAIQVSADRDGWETIAEFGGGGTGNWQSLDWSGETRYIRFRFANPNGDLTLGLLAEVRFFG